MRDFFNWPPSWATLLLLPALFIGFTVHELAHAVVAYLLGDTSQVERRRLSFNPLRHVSWLGMVAFLLVGLGWAKPVWVDHARFRIKNRAFGMFLVSVAGAAANLLTALLALVGMSGTVMIVWTVSGVSPVAVMEFLMAPSPGPDLHGLAVAASYYVMMVNLMLAFFNLLPLPPLDGFQALMSLFTVVRNALKDGKKAAPAPVRAAGAAASADLAHSPAQIHFDIGLQYHREGQLDEAIARYRQATAHDQQHGLAYYNLGLAHWAKGRPPLAISAFRAAQSTGDASVRVQANLRLHELTRAEQDPEVPVGPAPPPLEPGTTPASPMDAALALDPAVARRVWLRLSIGGSVMFVLAIAMWIFVTVVAFTSLGPG